MHTARCSIEIARECMPKFVEKKIKIRIQLSEAVYMSPLTLYPISGYFSFLVARQVSPPSISR